MTAVAQGWSYQTHFKDALASIESALLDVTRRWSDALLANPEGSFSHQQEALLAEAMAYAALGGGKRIRPLLVYLIGHGLGQTLQACLPAAVAIELLHTYSLVHDDLPAMDNDVLRRGRPTLHVKYNEAVAILVGDALQAEAFALLAEYYPDRPSMVRYLAGAAGVGHLIRGQLLDLQLVGRNLQMEEVHRIHRHKTGALFGTALALGACCARADNDTCKRLYAAGETLGQIFQIADDILDVTGSDADLGKSAGKDAQQDKNSILRHVSVPQARQMAIRAQESFQLQLADLPLNEPAVNDLTAIAQFMLARST